VCPVTLPDDHDQGLSLRKAIYKQYAQAIPGAYAVSKRGSAPCKINCPAQVSVQGFIALMKAGQHREALALFKQAHPFPGVCGRVCHHPCEAACSRQAVDEALSIRNLHRFIADRDLTAESPFVPAIKAARPEKVAVVGAGPAGLTCAYFLALEGYPVTVFEKSPVLGGMLTLGIPAYRLPREIIAAEIQTIQAAGVAFKTGVEIGKELTIAQLREDGFRAFFMGIGAQECKLLGIEGETLQGVFSGIEFLRKVNLGEPVALGERVAVVGGGNVAMDAVRTALRTGSQKPFILYRRSLEQMPAMAEEIEACRQEGIEIHTLTNPVRIIGENGRVKAVECNQMQLGEPDESGRRRPVPIPGSQFRIEVDAVIAAIGQETDWSCLTDECACTLNDWGTMRVDPVTLQSDDPDIFAGGDAATGPRSVVEAVYAGQQAAISIDRFIQGADLNANREKVLAAAEHVPLKGLAPKPRETMPHLPASESKESFREVQLGFDEKQSLAEVDRCLGCGICSECHQCVDVCLAGAIDHRQTGQTLELKVGSVLLATGFKPFEPKNIDSYPYPNEPNLLTSLEFERLLSPSGPFQGHIQRPSDGKAPKKIAWVQCVGSRSNREGAHPYCSTICCMAALKQTIISLEHVGNGLDTTVFMMDMRTHRKDFEKYYERAKQQGSRIIRARVHSIDPVNGTGDLKIRYILETGAVQQETFDMVVLSIGLEIPADMVELARRLGVQLNPNRFLDIDCLSPVATSRPGVYACGVITGPKDIPQTVSEASAAAAAATGALAMGRGTLQKKKVFPPESRVDAEPVRVGVFVCNCGINIGGIADVAAIVEYARGLRDVAFAEAHLFTCSQDAQQDIIEQIKAYKLNRIVVASCSPSTHQAIFQETLRNAGLNKYLFEMANIRNHCTWCHQKEPAQATQKCKDLVNMAVAKARLLQPLEYLSANVTNKALVVGGGVSGMVSALAMADQGYAVDLIERREALGGMALKLDKTWKAEPIRPYVEAVISKVQRHEKIKLHLGATVEEASGFAGNFVSKLSNGRQIEHGVAVLATGAKSFQPEGQYLFGKNPNVLQLLDMDSEIASGTERIQKAKAVAFIQCVGSRVPERPYCNKLCCSHSVENALKLKALNPQMEIFIIYRDMRTYGERESLYTAAREKGVIFIRYTLDNLPRVEELGGRLKITVKDHILQQPVAIVADVLALATAIVPNDNSALSQIYKVALNAEGFFSEVHAKIRPLDFATDGIFMAGLCHYPKPIEESIAEGYAAASRAATILSKDFLQLESTISHPVDENCDGCAFCIEPCPYQAISLVEYMKGGEIRKTVEVNEVRCKGCGSCMATCPKQGIVVKGFTMEQLGAQVEAALGLI
jgi:heterodisulfide reductase subunit A-like polyferredoxin